MYVRTCPATFFYFPLPYDLVFRFTQITISRLNSDLPYSLFQLNVFKIHSLNELSKIREENGSKEKIHNIRDKPIKPGN